MNNLSLVMVILTLVAMAFLAVPLWRGRRGESASTDMLEQRRETNREVFAQRQVELNRELEQGVVSAEDHARLLTELQRAFLRDMDEIASLHVRHGARRSLLLPLVGLALIPVLSVLLYQKWGAAQDLALPELVRAVREAPDEAAQVPAINRLAEELQRRFERKPDDLQSAYTLGTLYLQVTRYADAAMVFERMAQDMPPGPDRATVLGMWAQALYLVNEAKIDDKVQGIMDEALALNPNEGSVLSILALDALGRQDVAGAVGYWQRQLAASEPNSEQAQLLRQRIAAAQAYLPEDQRQSTPGATDAASITLVIDLDPQFKQRLGEFQNLFVYVRNPAMPMPILAQQVAVPEFPLTIKLDDSMSMTGMTLASAPELLAGARLSQSGGAVREAGDLQTESMPFKLSEQTEPLSLTIDQVVEAQ
jgi:cytochrome c-type biogenesis protein CcmH